MLLKSGHKNRKENEEYKTHLFPKEDTAVIEAIEIL